MTMKKEYFAPQSETVLLPCESLLLDVSESNPVPGVDADAPARKEFKPSFDHGNVI